MRFFRVLQPLETPDSKRWMYLGTIFQFPMILLFIINLHLFPHNQMAWDWRYVPDDVGIALFIWCMFWLYGRNRSHTHLIVTGPYRWTRHPMYVGIFLMNTGFWVDHPFDQSWLFYGLQLCFLIGLLGAGYCQEQETLARFGSSAAAYYARTPRLPWLV